MPARIRLTLAGRDPAPPYRHAEGLRALALSAIERRLPTLATAVHSANQPNPLTVSPLWTEDEERRTYHVEFSCVADELTDVLIRGLPRPGRRILLGRSPFDVLKSEIVAHVPFEELSRPAEATKLPLLMLTPTAHHAPGIIRRSVVVPDPYLYVGSWFRRWNLYGPFCFDESLLQSVAEQVVVQAVDGGTEVVRLTDRRTFIGFKGRLVLAVLEGQTDPADLATALWTLARFAEYCGTGVETMRGMGQTRLLEGHSTVS